MNNSNFADNILNNVFSNVTNIENAEAVNEMLDKYGLNWKVSKQPLFLPSSLETSFYGVVRDDDNACFATCKEAYQPFQNSELSEMLIRINQKTGYEMHSGGAFNGGGKVYLQLKSPNQIKGIGQNNDTVNGYLTGINSHDGTTSLKWGETNITISCRNTFMAATKIIKNSLRHTQSIKNNVEFAIRDITGIVKNEKSLFEKFFTLSEIPVKSKHISQIVQSITKVDSTLTKAELDANYSTYSVNRANDLLTAIAGELSQKGHTMWGVLSGVTNYTSHYMPVPKRENARLESIYTGTGYSINNDAFNLISEMAGI